jgi:hypothetical protein
MLYARWLIVESGMKRYFEQITIFFSKILVSLREIIRSQSPRSYTILGNILKFVMDIPLPDNIFFSMFLDKLWRNSQCHCHHGLLVCHVSTHNRSTFVFLVHVGSIDDHYVPDEHLSSSTVVKALY